MARALKLTGHLVFWLGYFILVINISQLIMPLFASITRAGIIVVLHIIMVYANTRYVVPYYFERKKYIVFFLLVMACIITISLIRVLLIDALFAHVQYSNFQIKLSFFDKLVFSGFASSLLIIMSTIYATAEKKFALQKENLEAELKLLKAQINPHFLFNTLNNIYALAYENSTKTAPMIMKLSQMMRYAYHDCETNLVLLSKEVEYIHNFVDLYQLRFEHSRDIRFSIEGKIGGQQIPPLLLNPILENAIKYSDLDENPEGYIHIQLYVMTNESVEFSVSNTFAPREEKHSEGIGLKNIKRRLTLLYSGRHLFITKQENQVFKTQIVLQLS
jgi:two-component system LytT family sensor kinase